MSPTFPLILTKFEAGFGSLKKSNEIFIVRSKTNVYLHMGTEFIYFHRKLCTAILTQRNFALQLRYQVLNKSDRIIQQKSFLNFSSLKPILPLQELFYNHSTVKRKQNVFTLTVFTRISAASGTKKLTSAAPPMLSPLMFSLSIS